MAGLFLAMALLAGAPAPSAPPTPAPGKATRGLTRIAPEEDKGSPVEQAVPSPAPPPTFDSPTEHAAAASAPIAPTTAATASEKRCDRAFALSDASFSDTAGFDATLRRLLSTADGPARVVDTPGFDPESPPPRLQAWFGAVQKSGGAVGRQDITCTRGFSLMGALRKLFGSGSQPDLYAPARNWNAVLWVEKAGGQVRQVQFVRRPAAPS